MANDYRVPVIDRMMQIIGYLESRPHGDTLANITRRLGIPKTTAYRILNTLMTYRLVEHDAGLGVYRLGLGLLRIAGAVIQSLDLFSVSRPIMEQLSARLRESCKLSVRDGDGALVVAVVQTPRSYGVSSQVGSRFPLHAGAASKVILAHMPESELQQLVERGLRAYTSQTITDPSKLRQVLADVRRQGWAEDVGEYVEGVRAVAAPVYDAFGRLVAALSVPFLASATPERVLEIRQAVIGAANQISVELGIRGQQTEAGRRWGGVGPPVY
ncbi:IclR family transcriptional regulator [Geochorda subterranea]|uniref:IclR family transcriptional regulator n=1 Tax=Geochorda subterranea TaxID=3109564 RepID=A0ABZ1BPR0_9FIRM|nr:IclR family transcriptional regulator [Limnochorda sp. LNt]WRP14525.1 IclR family transcriptional regulator [Limnochorda sp. LNt]